jgi:hypothetical protein
MADGGAKAGTAYGESGELGHKGLVNRADIHDLHATLLYLLGRSTNSSPRLHNSRRHRLTDVKGRVIHELIG